MNCTQYNLNIEGTIQHFRNKFKRGALFDPRMNYLLCSGIVCLPFHLSISWFFITSYNQTKGVHTQRRNPPNKKTCNKIGSGPMTIY